MNYTDYPHPSIIEINLTQFKKNIAIVRSHIKDSLFCLPVKANAYGHGLYEIANVAQEEGIDYLAVAHLQEAIILRQNNIHIPILVLGAIHEDQVRHLIDFDLDISISSKFKAQMVVNECKKLHKKCRIHLEVDTGMHRTGVRPDTAIDLFDYIKKSGYFNVIGIYSHLVSADQSENPFNEKQIEKFYQLMEHPIFQGENIIWHLANSGGTTFFSKTHLHMVRPALITFGYLQAQYPSTLEGIKSCFSIKTKVAYFKVVEEGEGIGYGHSFVTKKKTRIVTIPVGYGDGYRRSLSNKGEVLIRGKRFPIVGAICMDQFMVDIGNNEVYVGDEVVLIGKQGNEEITLQEVATLCDTIPYEILCLFNNRMQRVYIG